MWHSRMLSAVMVEMLGKLLHMHIRVNLEMFVRQGWIYDLYEEKVRLEGA